MLKRHNVYLIAVFLYAALIFYLSSIPNPPSPINYGLMRQIYNSLSRIGLGFLAYPFYLYILFPDKFMHFFLYLGFGIVLNLAVRVYRGSFLTSASLSLLFGSAYAASDEIHQIFTPTRSATVSDFFADFLGILTAQLLVFVVYKLTNLIKKEGWSGRRWVNTRMKCMTRMSFRNILFALHLQFFKWSG